MQKQISFAARLWYHILEDRAITLGQWTHCELVNRLCRCRFGLQRDHATKSRARNHGDLQDGPIQSSCRCDHLHLFCWWCSGRPSGSLGLHRRRIRVSVGRNVYSGEVQGGAEVLKRRVGVMRSFSGSWNPTFSRFTISSCMRLVPSLTCHTGEIGGRFLSAENLSTHLRHEPLIQRSMSSGQKKNFSDLRVVNL
jgi:hypothetical protein